MDRLLSIAILSSNRRDLLSATINSLLATLTYPYWELIIFNHNESIGNGWNDLKERVRGDYVLMCQDDWFFTEKWDWAWQSMTILKNKEFGIVRLRKDNDGQNSEKIIKSHLFDEDRKKFNCYEVECVVSGFCLNPFMCRHELLDEIGKCKKKEKVQGIAEIELREKYNKLNYKTIKLGNNDHGICVHIGRGRRILSDK